MNNNTIVFDGINLSMLRGVMACAATKDVRYYLNGISINSERVAGTDGTRCAKFPTPFATNGEPFSCTLSDNAVVIPTFKILSSTRNLQITVDGERVTTDQMDRAGNLTTSVLVAINGTYPDIGRIMPTDKAPCETIETVINPILASEVFKATKIKLCTTKFINGATSRDALRFVIKSLPALHIVIMPMHWKAGS